MATEKLVIGDLDVESGLVYCGGEDIYIRMLKLTIKNFPKHLEDADAQLANKDWENYIITVHGIKSSMKSIGANDLSERAKELEFAGKAGDYDTISAKHPAMVTEAKRVLELLKSCPLLADETTRQDLRTESRIISLEDMEAKVNAFEDAMYEFDETTMLQILSELSVCRCKSKVLEQQIGTITEKVREADYMSAGDDLRNLYESLR